MDQATQYVFSFLEGDGHDKKLLGGKGANLCEMTQIGLNVPPGFVISTAACLAYLDTTDRSLPIVDPISRQQIEYLTSSWRKMIASTTF